jgi:hypothetical protein
MARRIVSGSVANVADGIAFLVKAIPALREDGRPGLPTNIPLRKANGLTLGTLFRANPKLTGLDYGDTIKAAVESGAIYSTFTRHVGLISDRPFTRPDAKPATVKTAVPASAVLAKLGL